MTPERRRKRVYDYCLRRLKAEIAAGPRGTAARLSRELHISSAHIANLTGPEPSREMGEEVRDKLAAHWGMTPAQLETVALGGAVSGVPPEMPDPPYATLLSQIALQPGLQAELIREGAPWRVSTVVRAVTTQWESPDGLPRDGWGKLLEAIESGEIDQMSGGAAEATSAAKKQVGRRVKLPKRSPPTP